MEKDLWATASVNEDVAKALTVMLGNFRRLRSTDEATQSIAQLVGALKAGNEVAQEAALNALYLLQEDWPESPAEVGKAQALAAAEAIPILQYLVREGAPRFQEKAEILLQCLPGSLVVTVKQGHNLKQSVGSTNAFCTLTLGNGPPRQTKVGGPHNPHFQGILKLYPVIILMFLLCVKNNFTSFLAESACGWAMKLFWKGDQPVDSQYSESGYNYSKELHLCRANSRHDLCFYLLILVLLNRCR